MFPFWVSLNASTLFPFQLSVVEQVRVAAEAGYEGIELWVRDIEAYVQNGGTLRELKRAIDEAGIAFANAIAFFRWADADGEARRQGFAQAEREMRMLAGLGCRAIATPPYGNVEGVALDEMAARFAELVQLGRDIGIEPLLEFWGRAKKLSRLSEAVCVAMESGVSDAKILLDPFHMHTGGSPIGGLNYMNGERIGLVHVNDYPAVPSRDTVTDRDRVFPGDGVAPSAELARLLARSGYRGFLSLELFREDYGERSALEVARLGLEKVRAAYRV